MSCSKSEAKARQRRINDNNRRVCLKALIQKQKDQLRAEQRRERRQRRIAENIDSSDSDSDTDGIAEEAGNTVSFFTLSLFVVFFIVCILLFCLYFVYRRV
jgi:Flp pilus assembly protein TadB